MKRSLARGLLLAVLLASDACVARAVHPPRSLAQLVQSFERETAPYFPFTATERGEHQYDRVLANDIGDEYRRGLEDICGRYRRELQAIDPSARAGQERLTHDIFAERLDTCLESFRFPWHLLPVNQVGGWPSRFPVVGAGRGIHPFKTVQNYEDFLGRIDGFVVWVDTAIANMRTGTGRGITQPRAAMLKVIPQLEAQIVDDPRTSLFYEPVKNFPVELDQASRRALEEKYRQAITEKIVPAYRRLRSFMRDEYLPACRTSYGLRDIPGGSAMYAFSVRVSTTTRLTPDQIYDLGQAEVRRIGSEIAAVQAEIASAREPAPDRHATVDELLRGYAELRASVEVALPRLFGRFPRASFEIRPIEAFREQSTPSNYQAAALDGSRPGVFYLNAAGLRAGGSAPVDRSLFLHEAVPGHHFQITLQRENAGLPVFRRVGWHNAFGEGWALYAESLGSELGLHGDRHARLNMLQSELFRAARLVVDVGLHEKGWTREQAIDYLGGRRENAEREAERYMVWPGQALGYKIGQLKILSLRRKAEAALGPAFDVRAFHDELLKDGAMPLTILEAKMDRWIDASRSSR